MVIIFQNSTQCWLWNRNFHNCGEFKSRKIALTEMGISHPIKHGHTNDRESLPHTAPIEVNLFIE